MKDTHKITLIILCGVLFSAIILTQSQTQPFEPEENQTTDDNIIRIAVTYEKLPENVAVWPHPVSEKNIIALVNHTDVKINQYCRENQIDTQFRFIPTPVIHKGGTQAGENPPGLDEMIQLNETGINLIVGHDYSLANRYSFEFANENNMLLFSPQGVGIGLSIPDDNLFKLTPNYYENPDVYNQVFARMIKELGYKAFITINIEAYSIIRNVLEITATALNYSYRSTLVEMDINLNDIEPYIDRAEEYLIDAIDQYGVDKVCVLVVPLWSDDSDFLNIVDSHPVFSDVTWFDIVGISEELVFEEGFARRLDKYGFIQLIMSTSESKIADDFWRNYLDNIGPLPTPAKRYGEASRYDAMWIMAHAVIQVNSSSTDNVKKILPRVCNEYQGVIGNCTLDEKGDRISTDFDIYRWITQDEKPEFKKIGHYDSETGYIRTQD